MDEQDEEIANLLPKIKIMEQYYGRVEELALSLYNRRQDIKLTPEQNRVYDLLPPAALKHFDFEKERPRHFRKALDAEMVTR